MSHVSQDLRYGVRMWLKAPVVSAVAVLSLALGVAANGAMFAILNAFLFEPLPYADQDELVLLREARRGESDEMAGGVSVPDFRAYQEAADDLESSTAYTIEAANLTGFDVPEQLQVVVATPSLFDVLGVRPFLGRGFRPEEGAEGRGNVLVLGHDYWRSRFLGDRDVLGRTVVLDGRSFTVVGVMPEAFDMIPANVQAFRPSDFVDRMDTRGARGFIALGRLRPGATVEGLAAELEGVSARLAAEFPDSNRGWELRAIGLRDFFPGPTDTKLVAILTCVTLFGLLIACANVANLLLGRAEVRQKEVAVRIALGAGRTRILRQLLTESVLLGLAGGVLGVGLSIWVVGWLRTVMPPELPRAFLPELDPVVVLATLGVSVLAGIAFGVAPAIHATGGDVRESLGEASRGGTAGRRRKRLRAAFVIGEFAVAMALLTGAGVLVEAFDRLTNDDPGFDDAGLLTFTASVPEDRYPEPGDVALYQRELVDALVAAPGVEGVAVMSSLPRGRGNPTTAYAVEGRPEPDASERPTAGFQSVNADFFETLGIPLLRGRTFRDSDRADAPEVVIVSEAFARREFPDQDPVGERLVVEGESWQIVGVVGDILQERLALAGRGGAALYVPLAQKPRRDPSFALRAAGDPAALADGVRRAVWAVDPEQPLARLRTFEAHTAETLAGPRAVSLFLAVMGSIALGLAAMGIWGVMAHAVARQRREIGIRMALGAGRGNVVGMVTRSGLTLAGTGMLLGVPLSFLMYRAVRSTLDLFETGPGLQYAGVVAGALALIAVLATYLPARRASAVQPVTALKGE